jgi:hypothetical protein
MGVRADIHTGAIDTCALRFEHLATPVEGIGLTGFYTGIAIAVLYAAHCLQG